MPNTNQEIPVAAPLEGILVVELGHSVAAPFAGQTLADLGATVIKVENPGRGDDARNWGPPFWNGSAVVFQSVNRNKMSAAIDLKDPAQLSKLRAFIVERADIVVQPKIFFAGRYLHSIVDSLLTLKKFS